MKLRVDSIRRELAELRGSKRAAKGGVMLVPRMLTPDEYEAEAVEHQTALMSWSMEAHSGADIRDSLPEPMTADQERTFHQQLHASRHSGKSFDERAAGAYRKATGAIR